MDDKQNIFVGSETGLLKGLSVEKKKWINFNNEAEINKEKEINVMCWGDSAETQICCGTKSHEVNIFDVSSHNLISSHSFTGGTGPLRGLNKYEGNFITCTESGLVKLWKEDEDQRVEINVGENVYKMRQNAQQPNLFAIGGKENDLKVYDLATPEEPVFKAKNVRDDWLCLRVPVWVTDAAFVPDSQKIVTCTGHHQVRLYDPSTPQRRPVLDMEFDEYPITTMSLRPGENQVVVGNTQGNMALLDIRGKGHLVQKYKGFSGGIRCVQCHPSMDVVVSCGLDRFVRIHDLNSKDLLHKFYMKSRLNSLLLSSSWTMDNMKKLDKIGSQKEHYEKEVANTLQDNEEDESFWSELPVVKTKKLKKRPKYEQFETDISEIGVSASKKRLSAEERSEDISIKKAKKSQRKNSKKDKKSSKPVSKKKEKEST